MASSDGGASDLGLLALRLSGVGLAIHGYDRIFHGDMTVFAASIEQMGYPMPEVCAWGAALTQLLGGAMVAVGLFTRPVAAVAGFVMFLSAFVRHASDDFRTREIALLYLVVLAALTLMGAGHWSVDGMRKKS